MPDYDPTSTEGLAEHATERLQMNARGLFTSDLSVNEYLCIEKADFEPVGLVVGSSIYHIGYQSSAFKQNQEMDVLTQAMYEARELAMTRMEEEADQLGADGVVGVRLIFSKYAVDDDVLEFQAIGTAIRHRERGGSYRTKDNRPFTSDLSGQDLWKLERAGYRPVSLAMGVCVYHIAHLSFMQALKQAGQNQEMKTYTEATYAARERAMERMQKEAVERGGVGIV